MSFVALVSMRSFCRSFAFATLFCMAVITAACPAAAQRISVPPQAPPSEQLAPRRNFDVRILPHEGFRLSEEDEVATLDAIRIALSEVADGSSYVWYREHGHLNGLVSPTSSFKDGKGRVCRHILLILSAGQQTGRVEGIACRSDAGLWLLEG